MVVSALAFPSSPQLCFRCSEVVAQGSVFVAATLANAQEDRVWHPQCFKYVDNNLEYACTCTGGFAFEQAHMYL